MTLLGARGSCASRGGHLRSQGLSSSTASRRRRCAVVAAAAPDTPPERLRKLLTAPGIHLGPCAHDGLSARLIERAGFPFMFMSGFCVSASQLGMPDAGLMSYGEVVEAGGRICAATRLPVIGDGDTGYGNAVNAKRTVRGFAQAGFAGMLIEDQVARVRAAADARDEGAGVLIAARSDARSAESLQEALWRVAAFADAGADILFIDALRSREEMAAFAAVAPGVPKMANMLEGGVTPILSPAELQDMGFKIVAYPLSLLGVSIAAMEEALRVLRTGAHPPPDRLPSFSAIQAAVGFPEYYEEEARYAALAAAHAREAPPRAAPPPPPPPPPPLARPVEVEVMDEPGASAPAERSTSALAAAAAEARGGGDGGGAAGGGRGAMAGDWLRVRITDGATGVVQLDMRVPAGFLGRLGGMVPAVAGLDLQGMLDNALPLGNARGAPPGGGGGARRGARLLDVIQDGSRIEILLE